MGTVVSSVSFAILSCVMSLASSSMVLLPGWMWWKVVAIRVNLPVPGSPMTNNDSFFVRASATSLHARRHSGE